MRKGGSKRTSVLIVMLFLAKTGTSQDSLSSYRKVIDSFFHSISASQISFGHKQIDRLKLDSLRKEIILNSLPLNIDSSHSRSFLKKLAGPFAEKTFFESGGGYISYNWQYRSGNDTPFVENGISQHLISASFNARIGQSIPLRITYFERRSNSVFFKDFRDIRVDVDVQQFQQLRRQKELGKLKKGLENLRNPELPFFTKAMEDKLNKFRNLFHHPLVIRELIRAKEILIRKDFADTTESYRDSLVTGAKLFIQVYDSIRGLENRYKKSLDSLKYIQQKAEAKIKMVQQWMEGKTLSTSEAEDLAAIYGEKNKSVRKLLNTMKGIRTLSLGRTYPNYSPLTLQNLNVKGLDVEYSRKNIYLAAAAGTVDFRIRDFLFGQQKRVPQYVYLGKIGYGNKDYANITFTYFAGKKQLPGSSQQSPSAFVQGISLAGQIFVNKHTRLYGEIAQSGVPYANSTGYSPKSVFRFSDHSQQAYAFGISSWIPTTQTRVEGYYQYTGLNYQCFNSFQYNGTANSWSGRIEQPFWRRQLVLLAAVRKNDFTNSLVMQRYNANTIFKSLTLTFRKPLWPTLSIGYLPASQNTIIGNQVYESHFQSFTGNLFHQYGLGTARASTTLMYSRFYNDSRDSGFVYFNANNLYWNQSFIFSRFTSTIGASRMSNNQYKLQVLEAGLSAVLLKKVSIGFAVKINNLDNSITKLGFNTGSRFLLKHIGELNLWTEKNYLPGSGGNLYKYEMYNLGFTRFFK